STNQRLHRDFQRRWITAGHHKGHIESFVIPLAPLSEQRAIASVLGSLDDKIELNRRMKRDAGGAGPEPVQILVRGRHPIRRPSPKAGANPPSVKKFAWLVAAHPARPSRSFGKAARITGQRRKTCRISTAPCC